MHYNLFTFLEGYLFWHYKVCCIDQQLLLYLVYNEASVPFLAALEKCEHQTIVLLVSIDLNSKCYSYSTESWPTNGPMLRFSKHGLYDVCKVPKNCSMLELTVLCFCKMPIYPV